MVIMNYCSVCNKNATGTQNNHNVTDWKFLLVNIIMN